MTREQLDSPFQLQEHLKALHNHFTQPEGSDTVAPIHRDVAVRLAEPPEGVDRALWLYELCRFLTMKVNNLIVAFLSESPPCSSQTCPEMQASEWQYLCAVHDPPKTCCAIDYCCHTLDWATNILTSPKFFPSRLTLGSEASGGPQASMKHLVNIFRRLYRIFAHAWFKHRQVFWQVEGNEGLYIFFKTVCDVYHLMPEDSYTVPAEAEGIVSQPSTTSSAEEKPAGPRMSILKRGDENSLHSSSIENLNDAGATTRRHKHTPSTGSRVTTIAESAEDSEDTKPELVNLKEDAAAETVDESTEETAAPVENPEPQPSNDDTTGEQVDASGGDTEEAQSEEPVTTESDEVPAQKSTEEQEETESDQPEETQTEVKLETSQPNGESEPTSSTEKSSSEAAPPESEPNSKPDAKTETKLEEEKEPEGGEAETKSATELLMEP